MYHNGAGNHVTISAYLTHTCSTLNLYNTNAFIVLYFTLSLLQNSCDNEFQIKIQIL